MELAGQLRNTFQDSIMSYVTPAFLDKASQSLGLPVEKTRSALMSAVPTILGTVQSKLTTPDSAQMLMSQIREQGFDRAQPDTVLDAQGGEKGLGILRSLVGSGGMTAMMNKIAALAGVSTGSAQGLTAIASSAVFAFLGNHLRTSNWSMASLTGLLGMAPFGGLAAVENKLPNVAGRRAWGWAALGLVILGGLWWMLSRPTRLGPITEVPPANISSGPATSLSVSTAAAEISNFLASPEAGAVPKAFSLNDLRFAPGSAVLSAQGMGLARDLAAVLNDHPTARLRVEGHTDNRGGTAMNQSLSQSRADSLKGVIVSSGIDSGRVEAVGSGETKPVASNATEAGRQQNRRTDIWVLNR